jgi:hypothetical protein
MPGRVDPDFGVYILPSCSIGLETSVSHLAGYLRFHRHTAPSWAILLAQRCPKWSSTFRCPRSLPCLRIAQLPITSLRTSPGLAEACLWKSGGQLGWPVDSVDILWSIMTGMRHTYRRSSPGCGRTIFTGNARKEIPAEPHLSVVPHPEGMFNETDSGAHTAVL